MAESRYAKEALNPSNKDYEKFTRALKTGRPYVVNVWNRGDRMSVRAMGILSPQQFVQNVATTEYTEGWHNLTHNPQHPLAQRYPKVHETFMGNIDYDMDKLIESVRTRGVRRPVIVSKQKIEGFDWDSSDPNNVKAVTMPPRHQMLDGHHRAYAALQANVPIPVWQASEERITLR